MASHLSTPFLLILLAAGCCQLSPASAQVPTPVTQLPFSSSELAPQTAARAAYFSAMLAGGGGDAANLAANVRNFAATPVGLGGGFISLATFVVNTAIGTPPVTVPLIVDTGSHVCFTQGPNCTTCPSGGGCQNSPFGANSGSTCPYGGPIYDPSQSSTAVTSTTCAQCAGESFGATGCLEEAFSPPNTCQFEIRFGIGNAAGRFTQDVVSVGSVSSGGQRLFIGTTTFQSAFEGTAGLLGFGPAVTSLPVQLKQVGALPSSTFALCLASGTSNGGTLFLGGVPDQPGGAPYDISYTGPLLRNPFVFFIIPNPTNVLLNGNPVAGAASALQSDTNAGSAWIVDSGTTLTVLGTPLYDALLGAIKTAVGCPNTISRVGLDFIDLTTCNPPFTSFSNDELYSRFPTLTLQLQGTQAVARPKSYLYPLDGTNRFVNPGIDDGGPASSNPNNAAVRIVGDSFITDNLVVFDAENSRVGFASVNCDTLLPLAPASSNPSPTVSPPTTPVSPGVSANPGPDGTCSSFLATPNQCYTADGTGSICCAGQCPNPPAVGTPNCGAGSAAPPTTPAPTVAPPTTPAPTVPVPAPTTSAPTVPVPAPTTSAPVLPASTTPASPGGSANPGPDGTCSSLPATPNQCYTSDGTRSICCAGQCPNPPAVGNPSCGAGSPAAPTPTNPAPAATNPAPNPTTNPTTPAPVGACATLRRRFRTSASTPTVPLSPAARDLAPGRPATLRPVPKSTHPLDYAIQPIQSRRPGPCRDSWRTGVSK
ncbi:aspartyl protease-like protein [Klebsormidium nitens]|uniref:Aspartyl protease-like protein n=1 Tax=Klebsormidium nitens TaxID=105231 RepID=A0A1Y1I019_KLENI|nr:aspartyl protease-like protein [Klebsormidium nitens]|eukprot:GAQ83783.1 aspartyl protease-like protein [Klebsormidium nitens]